MNDKAKIVVTVPEGQADALREAIGKAGGGKVGNYDFCSFSTQGTGRFRPNDQASPTTGQAGEFEAVQEERIEITCDRNDAAAIVTAIKKAHSYEEPAIDVYPLLTLG